MTGKVVLVTGGSKGIGAGCARVFVAAGATVAICARDATVGSVTAAELSAMGPGSCHFEGCDVADLDALGQFVDRVGERYGRLDCLVNNAVRYPGLQAIDDVPVDLITTTLHANVVAYIVAAQRALPYLRRTKGSIVNISSIVGAVGQWRDAVYAASKGAITSFTKALAIEEAANGVRVNAILPGNVLSDARIRAASSVRRPQEFDAFIDGLQWMGRSGTNEEVGHAALFLASEMASFCTGVALIVSGGLELGFGPKLPYPDFDAPREPPSTAPPPAG